MVASAGHSSGTYSFRPAAADIFLEAFARIGIFSPSIERLHMIECRRSANLILTSKWQNRGPNLWEVGPNPLCVALQPAQSSYLLPIETVDILDSYLRQYTPGPTAVNIGNGLTPVGPATDPLTASPFGDVLLLQPASGTLSCTAGNQFCTLVWPHHGQQPGNPLFWGCPITIGGMTLYNFSIVDNVVDGNTLQFLLPDVARETQALQGATTLFCTAEGSPGVTCVLPGHGLIVGDMFPVQIPTPVGGLVLNGIYPVTAVQSLSQFTINVGEIATDTAMMFENGGQLSITGQCPGIIPTDIFLYPLSRDDYAMLPDKAVQGRPTQYWFNRTIVPSIVMWPVPNSPNFGQIPPCPPQQYQPPPYYGMCMYRMRQIQDTLAIGGQVLDLPNRFLDPFSAELAAAMAEKFKPEMHLAKVALAKAAWDEAAAEDREKVSFNIGPDFTSYSM